MNEETKRGHLDALAKIESEFDSTDPNEARVFRYGISLIKKWYFEVIDNVPREERELENSTVTSLLHLAFDFGQDGNIEKMEKALLDAEAIIAIYDKR